MHRRLSVTMARACPQMRRAAVLTALTALYICASASALVHQPARVGAKEPAPTLTRSTDEVVQEAYRTRSSEIIAPARQPVHKQRNRRMEPGAHRQLDATVAVSHARRIFGTSVSSAASADHKHIVDGGPIYRDSEVPQGAAKPHQRQVLHAADDSSGLHGAAMDMMDDDERLVLLKDIHSSDSGSLFHPLSGPDEEDTQHPQAAPAPDTSARRHALDADSPCSALPSGCAEERHAPSFIRRWLHLTGAPAPGTRAARQLPDEPAVSGKGVPGQRGNRAMNDRVAYSQPFGALGLFSGAGHPTGVKSGFSSRSSLR